MYVIVRWSENGSVWFLEHMPFTSVKWTADINQALQLGYHRAYAMTALHESDFKDCSIVRIDSHIFNNQ